MLAGRNLELANSIQSAVRINLPALSRDEVTISVVFPKYSLLFQCTELVCGYFHIKNELPLLVTNLLESKCNGNPLFAVEMTRSLIESEDIIIDRTGTCRITEKFVLQDKEGTLPATLDSVLTSCLSQLLPHLQILCKVSAALGTVFTASNLRAVYPLQMDAATLESMLNSLVAQGIFATDNVQYYWFQSSTFQQAVYNLLLFEQRYMLHEKIANHLQSLPGTDIEELAFHYMNGISTKFNKTSLPLIGKAIHTVFPAGMKALATSAHKEARQYLQWCLEMVQFLPPSDGRLLLHPHTWNDCLLTIICTRNYWFEVESVGCSGWLSYDVSRVRTS